MPEKFIQHLLHNIEYTWAFAFFFVMWPLAFGLGGSALSISSDEKGLGLGEAIRRSVSWYLWSCP